MSIVLNEVKQAEHIIEKGEVGNKPTSTLFLLGKYYRIKKNLDKKQTFSKMNEFMENNYKNYNSCSIALSLILALDFSFLDRKSVV